MARESTRRRVHGAALTLAGTQPASALTMEGIATGAGVSKQTLYRSWPSTGAILCDALLARSTDAHGSVIVPNSGNLARDLHELATGMITELTDAAQERVLRALTAQLQSDETLAEQYRELLLRPQMDAISGRFQQSAAPAPDDLAELFVGPILHRWLLRSRPFDAEWIDAHVHRVLRTAAFTGAGQPDS